MLHTLNDVSIIPSCISKINSRSECNVYDPNAPYDYLPLFTAPMSCIIDEDNYSTFKQNKIYTIVPRNIDIQTRLKLSSNTFVAVSLDEFKEHFINVTLSYPTYVCIDVANGHMLQLLELCKEAKEKHKSHITIMTGNIANPETYLEYAKVGIDYIRLGIGTGNVCTTSANSGVYYPMASLIQECVKIKNSIIKAESDYVRYDYTADENIVCKSIPKIIADGGFKNFDHIIKALALGADYVMLGEIFAKTFEACGAITVEGSSYDKWLLYHEHLADLKNAYKMFNMTRDYYGMSTKRAQKEFRSEGDKTAEGIAKTVRISYTLAGWCDNFIHYLQTAMSYTNSHNLSEFKNARIKIISNQSFNSYYK